MHWASQPVLDLGQDSKVQLSSVKDPDSRYEASFPPPVEDMWAVFRAAAVSQSLAVESIACGINAARSAFAFAEQPEAHQQSALMPARTLDYARPQASSKDRWVAQLSHQVPLIFARSLGNHLLSDLAEV